MTFYGESIGIDRFTNVSGSAVADLESVQLRAGSVTFTAGDSTRFATDLTYHYLDSPATPTVVSWVVEVLSGSGTLTFAEGIGNTGTSLGSVTVTGAGQYVVASTFTTANVWADVDARLLMTCTSGTVVVQQVKLRVWPPEGAAGTWSDLYPSWESAGPAPGTYVSRAVVAETSTNSGASAEWDAVIAAGQAHADEPYTNPGGSTFGAAPLYFGSLATIRAEENTLDGTSGGTFNMGPLFAVAVDKTPGEGARIDESLGLVEGVDYIRPPDEVPFDLAVIYQAAGSQSTAWANVGVHVQGNTGPEGAATITVQPYAGDIEALPAWPDTGATVLADGDNAVTAPGGDVLLFAGSHLWMSNAPDFPGGLVAETAADWQWALGVGNPAEPGFQPLSVDITYPPYRLWNPNAVVETPQFTRTMQRGDGLGMGSGRVYSTGTRQASTRVFGTH